MKNVVIIVIVFMICVVGFEGLAFNQQDTVEEVEEKQEEGRKSFRDTNIYMILLSIFLFIKIVKSFIGDDSDN